MKWFQFIFQWFSIVDLHSFHHNIRINWIVLRAGVNIWLQIEMQRPMRGLPGVEGYIAIFETAHVSPQVRNRVYTIILELLFDFI